MKINVLIPFRDRHESLERSLPKINASLIALGLEPTFFIVEQANSLLFNKGMLWNAGFLETKKITNCNYWVFHDVEPYEETPGHLNYGRVNGVRHVYGMEFNNLGGIFCLDSKTYELANGFSNNFWGWGKEDDDFRNRIYGLGLKLDIEGRILRRKRNTKIIKETISAPDLSRERKNLNLLKNHSPEATSSGLSNVDYELIERKEKKDNIEWFMIDVKPNDFL